MIKKETFKKTLKKVMDWNEYGKGQITVAECSKIDCWTPCDLILREYYNNGGGSSQGFLGISPKACINAYEYIKANQVELFEKDYINQEGISNAGFTLWKGYIR